MLVQPLGQALAARLPTSALSGLLALSPALLRSLSTASADLQDEAPAHDKRYVDRLKLTARGGKGGNGCVSFYQGTSRGTDAMHNPWLQRRAVQLWVGSCRRCHCRCCLPLPPAACAGLPTFTIHVPQAH